MIRPEVAESKCRSAPYEVLGRGNPGGLLLAGRQSRSSEEGGILPEHPKKFSVAMVKLKSFIVNGQIVEKSFCQCSWEI